MRIARVVAGFWLLIGCGSSAPEAAPPARVVPAREAEAAAVAPPTEDLAAAPRADRAAPPPTIRVRVEDEEAIDEAVEAALERGASPGCVVIVGRADGVVFRRAYGARAVDPAHEAMTADTIFDLASVTKAVATATSAMVLVDRGRLDLDAPAHTFLPALRGGGRERITVRHLLTHTSGLPAVNALREYTGTRAERIARIASTGLTSAPGSRVGYSDLGFILLGEIVAAVSGTSLPDFAQETLFAPLGMHDTAYRPLEGAGLDLARIAPTERAERRGGVMIRGEVHDPRAHRLSGVSGNAGLFSTGDDLSRFARMLLGGGALDGARVLSPERVREMTGASELTRGRRALGWDLGRAGMSPRAFGHGGYTGTALWVDPEQGFFLILLSNRVHPDGTGDVGSLARVLGPLAARAARGAEELGLVPASDVLNGVDVLVRDGFDPVHGRVALLTHRAARTRDGRRTLDVLHAAPGVEVVRVLAPEHGLSSAREGHIDDGRDPQTGLPVLGLFGRTRTPTDAMLEGLDAVVIDLQDVGVRFYTYASTVRRVLEAAADRGLRVVILDRPDPLGGREPAGPVSTVALASFVNHHPLPVRHGMTLGELATLLNDERGIGAQLEVVEISGWRHGTPWAETGLRWVPPSPNLRTLEQVELYPGLALLEGTNVSVGRGTDTPFEVLGAPWIDGARLAAALADVRGVRVEPIRFTPRASRFRGQRCEGVRFVRLEEAGAEPQGPSGGFDAVDLGMRVAAALRGVPGGAWEPERMVRMLGDRDTHAALLDGVAPSEIERRWGQDLSRFAALRRRYLRYDVAPR